MKKIFVSGSFDDLRLRHIRLLDEASRLGSLFVQLWPDSMVERLEGHPPKFTLAERLYIINAIRYVSGVEIYPDDVLEPDSPPCVSGIQPDVWVVDKGADNIVKKEYCESHGMKYVVIPEACLRDVPEWTIAEKYPHNGRRRIIVTGCFDWLHSGHIRFFEEVAGLGELYVSVGHDANLRLLKGEGHPMFPETERRYMVQSICYVKESLITSGSGWMDAAPEIKHVGIDTYVVNEDGDKPEKRAYCEANGLDYIVLKRIPRDGLPRRESSILRGY